MMKRLASAAALTLIFAGAAFAQAPAADSQPPQAATETVAPLAPGAAADTATPAPAETGSIAPGTAGTEARAPAGAASAAAAGTVESCIAAAADLGSTAESKSLTAEKADRLDALFSKMETLCDGEQFAEAETVADDIRSIISAN